MFSRKHGSFAIPEPLPLSGDATKDVVQLQESVKQLRSAILSILRDFDSPGSIALAKADINSTPIGRDEPDVGNFTTIGATTPGAGTFTQVTITVTTGTPPMVVASTTKVANLNADLLDGGDWAIPGAIGTTTPTTGKFTTVQSTIATGTAPLIIASTTKVANLNADLLDDKDWVAPGTIGSTTPNTGAFTTLSCTGNATLGDASSDTLNVGNGGLVKDASGVLGINVTPGAWQGTAGNGVLQFGTTGGLASLAGGVDTHLTAGSRYDGTNYKYMIGGYAVCKYTQVNGVHTFSRAASGSAGNNITWTDVFTLDASGNATASGKFVTSANGEGSNHTPTTATSAAYKLFHNTGGDTYVGLDNSTGSTFGGGNYAFCVYSAQQIVLFGGGVKGLVVTTDGRLYGSALHNNAGAVTGTANQYLASGTYTPTINGVANVAASTARVCTWSRVGNKVTVSGQMDIDPTLAAPTGTTFDISLPIASAFAQAWDAGGSGTRKAGTAYEPVAIEAETAGDTARFNFIAANAANATLTFQFGYVIL